MWCLLCYILWTLLAINADRCSDVSNSRIVQTTQGPVRGYRDPKGSLFTFRSIPYATAPTGRDRYKAPLPPPTWTEPLEAVDNGIICPQSAFPLIPSNSTTLEDCLIANVYVPCVDPDENNLPVIVYVHGGGFQLGFGDWLKPMTLARDHKIIAVTFNYRIGVHGFLCLGTEDVPGNAGMKDQVALLRWVKNNIASFGGNPDDITISGYSSGAMSVDLLMLAKSADGLFHKIIPESGSSIGTYTIQYDPLKVAKFYAKKQNFDDADDIYALEEFYKTISIELMKSNAFMNDPDSANVFSPCIENSNGDNVFLDDDPVNIIKSGNYKKVPLLYGFANMEGLLAVPFFDNWKVRLNENFSEFLPHDLELDSEEKIQELAKMTKEFYFGDKPISDESILSYVNYFTDYYFAIATLRSIELHLEAGHDAIYLYEYSFVDQDTPIVPHTDVRGATHCAQTTAVFDGVHLTSSDETSISDEYKEMKTVMRQIWANFIKTGKPVPDDSDLPKWPPVNSPWTPYMSLGSKLELKGSLLHDRAQFWNGIYQRYFRTRKPAPSLLRRSEL